MIIGLMGGKGAGKDTIAAYLAKAYGARVYAIAGELKELLRIVFRLSEEQLHGSQDVKETVDPRWGLSPRQLMEVQGDALRRVYGDFFQVQRLLCQIAFDSPSLAVVSDVRYSHEAAKVRPRGVLWRIHPAPGLHRWSSSHSSEAEWMLPEVDLEITPAKEGLAELYSSIDEACHMAWIPRQKVVA